MAVVKFSGSGAIATADYKSVKWVGKTKSGKAVTISGTNAINLENIDFTLADKDEIVPSLTFTMTYSNTNAPSSSTAEPWEIELEDGVSATDIVLGCGVFYIGETAVGLTRGGGKFTVERTYRNIVADGDRGPVKDRIALDESVAKLQMNLVQFIANMDEVYPAITKA